jgi:hypothetical protein
MEKIRIGDVGCEKAGSGIRDNYSGSATLLLTGKKAGKIFN